MTGNEVGEGATQGGVPSSGPAQTGRPRRCRVIGLGASAGGLVAFQDFLGHVPEDSGFAYVLVQHLAPDHASALADILQRSTIMPVLEAGDRMLLLPDHVYVIPPNRDMVVVKDRLALRLPEALRGHRLPIDEFMTSLAAEHGDGAIGIILSGTGSDGTSGLRRILEAGGQTYVQAPDTAKYDGMPKSAIQAGVARSVAPVAEIAASIFLREAAGTVAGAPAPAPAAVSPASLKKLLSVLRNAVQHDFSLYKKPTLLRRIERRMALHDLKDIEIYIRYLRESPHEVRALFKELLIKVSGFFRDPEAFRLLKDDVLPGIVEGKPEGYVLRIWVAGCATGEEAYSIAIILREMMAETQRDLKVQLYSTDLDEDAITRARAGLYAGDIARDVSADRLARFFIKEPTGYRIAKEVREMVVFAVQSVIKDPPFTRLDLISCRNLMIYFEPEIQNRLMPVFHYALRPEGVLFLSPSESPGNNPELFSPISRKWKLYRANHAATSTTGVIGRGIAWRADDGDTKPEETVVKAKDPNFGDLARRLLLQAYAPPSVVTDAEGDIRYVFGETGKCLRPAPGDATLNVVDMAAEGLRFDLRNALSAAAQGTAVIGREVLVKTGQDVEPIGLSVRPLPNPTGAELLLLISFQEGATPRPRRKGRGKTASGSAEAMRINQLEQEMIYLRQILQANSEEHQAANEEFKSTNEELQSTNEELQSTNEELETSKEEIQSVNEELTTVNTELQVKIEQLGVVQNDMKNLLDNINVGTVFLDRKMLIRRFTREATRIYRLVPTDVGRPLVDIKSALVDDDLVLRSQEVIESLVPFEREIRTQDGASFQARIQPYQTIDNFIDGVVLTFSDLSHRMAAETSERNARILAQSIIDTVREPLIVIDGAGQVVSASRSFYRRFDLKPEEAVGQSLYELPGRRWSAPALRDLIEKVLPREQGFEGFVIENDIPGEGPTRAILNARRVVQLNEDNPLILLAIGEIG